MQQHKKCIVIGGGFGGMAAALRARRKGYAVTLIDRGQRLGGKAQVYQCGPFRHDAGPTVITAPQLFDELFDLFGKRRRDYIEFIPLDLWYRFRFHDGTHFNYGGTLEDTLTEIEAISPEDMEGYKQLLERSKAIYQIGFEQLADQPFHRLSSLIRCIPSMLRLRSDRSVWQLVCRYLKSDKLRQAFSMQPLLVGGNPFDTTSIYNLIHYLERKDGIFFPKGGTGALVDSLTQLMLDVGIDIRLQETVSAIRVNKNQRVTGVSTDSKQHFGCDIIIANTDPSHLYQHMLPQHSVKKSAHRKRQQCEKSMGLFVLFFGTKKQFPKVAHHTISLGPRYQALLEDIFQHKTLADDFSLYLHRPTATDPSFAPEGCDSFYALVPVPNLQGGQDWTTIGPILQKKVLENLDDTLLPGCIEQLDHVFYKTPLDFKNEHLCPDGEGFSIAPTFKQSAWFRYHNHAEGPKNLYLVGAGTHPGAGLPGVLCSAKVVDRLLTTVPQHDDSLSNTVIEQAS
jgi:phytoene desaturase